MTSAPGTELLAAVERSPAAAAAHDRAGWVRLFTQDGCIEDPVGSRPHVGRTQIGRFYDTFIDPRHITFHRDLDVVAGTSVIRDLTLEVTMGASVTMTIPAFLRYDLRPADCGWAISHLRAYWELPAMVLQFLGHGANAVPASLQLSRALLGNQGLTGTAGFLRGFAGARTRRKRLAENFLADVTKSMSSRAADDRLVGGRWEKVIAAGQTVAASVTTPSGRGVVVIDINAAATEIKRVTYFPGSLVR
jgi:hypothetical protein